MKQYIYNVCMALLCRNPYEGALSELRDKVCCLNDLYYRAVGSYHAVSKKVDELEVLVSDGKKREESLQQLVENLRCRISDYQRRIEEYNKEIDRLQKQNN